MVSANDERLVYPKISSVRAADVRPADGRSSWRDDPEGALSDAASHLSLQSDLEDELVGLCGSEFDQYENGNSDCENSLNQDICEESLSPPLGEGDSEHFYRDNPSLVSEELVFLVKNNLGYPRRERSRTSQFRERESSPDHPDTKTSDLVESLRRPTPRKKKRTKPFKSLESEVSSFASESRQDISRYGPCVIIVIYLTSTSTVSEIPEEADCFKVTVLLEQSELLPTK